MSSSWRIYLSRAMKPILGSESVIQQFIGTNVSFWPSLTTEKRLETSQICSIVLYVYLTSMLYESQWTSFLWSTSSVHHSWTLQLLQQTLAWQTFYPPRYLSRLPKSKTSLRKLWMEPSLEHSRWRDLQLVNDCAMNPNRGCLPCPFFAKSRSVSLAALRSETPSPA